MCARRSTSTWRDQPERLGQLRPDLAVRGRRRGRAGAAHGPVHAHAEAHPLDASSSCTAAACRTGRGRSRSWRSCGTGASSRWSRRRRRVRRAIRPLLTFLPRVMCRYRVVPEVKPRARKRRTLRGLALAGVTVTRRRARSTVVCPTLAGLAVSVAVKTGRWVRPAHRAERQQAAGDGAGGGGGERAAELAAVGGHRDLRARRVAGAAQGDRVAVAEAGLAGGQRGRVRRGGNRAGGQRQEGRDCDPSRLHGGCSLVGGHGQVLPDSRGS